MDPALLHRQKTSRQLKNVGFSLMFCGFAFELGGGLTDRAWLFKTGLGLFLLGLPLLLIGLWLGRRR